MPRHYQTSLYSPIRSFVGVLPWLSLFGFQAGYLHRWIEIEQDDPNTQTDAD